jgi:hypothetical protein
MDMPRFSPHHLSTLAPFPFLASIQFISSTCHYFLVIVPPFNLKILPNTALPIQLPTLMFVFASVDTDLESGTVEQVSLLRCTLCISIISHAGQRLAPFRFLSFLFAYPFSP